MFIGDFNCKIDSKKRVVFPSVFRKQMDGSMQEKFILKKDRFEPMLVLYHIEEWKRQVEKIKEKIDPLIPEHNKLFRGFYYGAAELLLDGSGRLLFPKRLLEQVGITKNIVMAGRDMTIEIWDEQKYYDNEMSNDEYLELVDSVLRDKKE